MATASINLKLIAPCGMNCAVCIAFLREKKKCSGCNFECVNKSKSCQTCIIKNCELLAETTSGFCYECAKFPCRRLNQLDKRYRTKYNMSMIANLKFIKTEGAGKFLSAQESKYTCKYCGQILSTHRNECLNCGVTAHYL